MKKVAFFVVGLLLLTGSAFSQYIFPVNFYENEGEIRYGRFDVSDQKIFWPLGEKGLLIFDATDVQNLRRLKLYKPYEIRSYNKVFGSSNSIELKGDTGYLAHGDLGFEMIDFSSINDPKVIGRYYRHQEVYNFTLFQDYALLALDHMGVEVIDISDFKDIKMVSRKNFDGVHVNNIDVLDNYLIASCGVYGIKIIPYEAPLEKFDGRKFTREFTTENDVHKIIIHNGYGILANDADGLCILDLSLPEYPSIAKEIKTKGSAKDIFLQGNLLYVATTKGIEILNVEDPLNHYNVDQYQDKKRNFQKIEIEGKHLYATYKSGMGFWKKFGMMIFEIQ